MGKYKYESYSDQESVELNHIANEMAEANRLKRIELIKELPSTIKGPMPSIKLEDLEDQA